MFLKEKQNKTPNIIVPLVLLIVSVVLVVIALTQGASEKKFKLIDQDGDNFYTVKYKGQQADCDDNDKTIYPGAAEIEGDGIDQDCDGMDKSVGFDSLIFEGKFREYEEYGKLKKIEIYRNFTTPSEINKKTIVENSKRIKTEGEFEAVYLYVEAGVGRELNSLGPYDSLYFYIDTGENGGHLLRSKSFAAEKGEGVGYTILLYKDMLPVTYLPYKEREPLKEIGLLEIINSDIWGFDRKHYLGAFVSTLQYGEIIKMNIAYKCRGDSQCFIQLIN